MGNCEECPDQKVTFACSRRAFDAGARGSSNASNKSDM
jgi:hypothetical protein